MTTKEFRDEFMVMYNSASFGAPDLNNYEVSLFLTQAVRDIVKELYSSFEYSEFSKRALNPLIRETALILLPATDYYKNVIAQEVILPNDIYFILQENIKISDDCIDVEVISEDLDNLNITMKNPFKRPSKRKVIRTEIGNNRVRLYSKVDITNYKIKYVKKYSPIIVSNFASDLDLLGTETIDGLSTLRTTELPVFLHDTIVKRAVILAIKSLRENNLKTQIEV